MTDDRPHPVCTCGRLWYCACNILWVPNPDYRGSNPRREYPGPCAATQAELHTYWHLQNGQGVVTP